MKSMEITAVGIDVSKSKSTVAIRRPGGVIVARPFDISHSNHDLEKLVSILKTTGGDIRVVMEHTSNYWKPIALTLKEADFYVSVVNAMLIHDFSDNSIQSIYFWTITGVYTVATLESVLRFLLGCGEKRHQSKVLHNPILRQTHLHPME